VKVAQISIGRFHHFHLARQLQRHGLLDAIYTGYPRVKLRDELGVPPEKIRCFPWLQAPYMVRGRFGLGGPRISREWEWWARRSLDAYAAFRMASPEVPNALIALSGCGLNSGRQVQRHGGRYFCDRGSSHIRFQDDILREEHKRWGFPFNGIDPRIIEREEAEYAASDGILVPSEFVRQSFLSQGVPANRLFKVPYGARLDRFHPSGEPDPAKFSVLFVGQVSLRKGFLDLLDAFSRFSHPAKELRVIGSVSPEVREWLASRPAPEGVNFLGIQPNAQLRQHYSEANALVLPSIEEGLSMVMGEALACGCPVIATPNTGAADLFTDGSEGFMVPIRDPSAMVARFDQLAQDSDLRARMRVAAVARVGAIGGWDVYGDRIKEIVLSSIREESAELI